MMIKKDGPGGTGPLSKLGDGNTLNLARAEIAAQVPLCQTNALADRICREFDRRRLDAQDRERRKAERAARRKAAR